VHGPGAHVLRRVRSPRDRPRRAQDLGERHGGAPDGPGVPAARDVVRAKEPGPDASRPPGARLGMNAHISTRTVDAHVKRLREKLGAAREYVETVRGVGYCFRDAPEPGDSGTHLTRRAGEDPGADGGADVAGAPPGGPRAAVP